VNVDVHFQTPGHKGDRNLVTGLSDGPIRSILSCAYNDRFFERLLICTNITDFIEQYNRY